MASRSRALPWKAGRFSGQDFAIQPDGALSCPAGKTLRPTEQQSFADGSLRVLVPRQNTRLSRLPFAQALSVARGSNHEAASDQFTAASSPGWSRAAAATRDWSRREQRRACMQLVRHQRIEVSLPPPAAASPRKAEVILSRAQRAHSRLSWEERLARNARAPTAGQVTIKLFGIPEIFAASLGLATA